MEELIGRRFVIRQWDDSEEVITLLSVDRLNDLAVVRYDDGALQRVSLQYLLKEELREKIPKVLH